MTDPSPRPRTEPDLSPAEERARTAEPATPLMRQYAAIKKEHPNALLFFRLGDFYELFFDDATIAARELEITLTSRNKEKGIPVPMCGVPYHAAEGYIHKLIRKGYKVAICEQMEDPRFAKKLVRREVTRVVTPGTAADSMLGAEENNFLAAVAYIAEGRARTQPAQNPPFEKHAGQGAQERQRPAASEPPGAAVAARLRVGFAALDLSTGEFRATEFSGPDAERRVWEELEQLRPREVLFASSAPLFDASARTASSQSAPLRPTPATGEEVADSLPRLMLAFGQRWARTPLEDWVFAPDYAAPLVENQFGVLSLEGFGLAGRTAATCAAGAILHYVRSTQRGSLDHVDRIGFYERQNCLVLDAVTVRNLELIEPLFTASGDNITLFRALDSTHTPMGKRLLRAWLLRPSVDTAEIEQRLDAVEELARSTVAREELRRQLQGVLDVERLLSRIALETATPPDLLALAVSLGRLPGVRSILSRTSAQRLASLGDAIDDLPELRERIERTLVEEPPLTLAEGGVIRSGVEAELDELRALSRNSKQYLAQIEERERQRTGIASLKVKFNNVFGYYIEISKANLHLAPRDYERKQTLVNAERFATPELKEYEAKILDAQEKIVEIERRLFAELRAAVAAEARRIRQTALALAQVDVLASLAHVAAVHNYCRPRFLGTGEIEILAGRHPVIERQDLTGSAERFVPNDLYLNASTHTILLLTGPNMGGKSTYLRQAALIVLMAQMGSFVPAQAARLSLVDRIFTRIGAADNLARGRSTFMVEMTETAAILNTATPNSLVLLDEVGRGTSTYDGLAIAWAAIEYLHARTRAKTLFATHYHELTELAAQLTGVQNFHVAVKETGSGVVFLRKVAPGAADKSYGIEVAKLAGLPPELIARAREVLAEHEQAEHRLSGGLASDELNPAAVQLTMFSPASQRIADRLRELDLDRLTPLEALNLLHELRKELE